MSTQEIMITPPGIASYPWLNKPDYKFDKLGLYQMKLIVAKDTVRALINQLVKMNEQQEGYDKTKAEWPFSDEIDDQGVQTGNTIMNFKMKAKIVPRKGDPWEQKPIIKNAQGERVVDVKVGSGSEIQVAFEPVPYSMTRKEGETKNTYYGVSLRLKAIRVLKLVEYTEGDVDFGEVPAGYETKEDPKYSEVGGVSDDVPF